MEARDNCSAFKCAECRENPIFFFRPLRSSVDCNHFLKIGDTRIGLVRMTRDGSENGHAEIRGDGAWSFFTVIRKIGARSLHHKQVIIRAAGRKYHRAHEARRVRLSRFFFPAEFMRDIADERKPELFCGRMCGRVLHEANDASERTDHFTRDDVASLAFVCAEKLQKCCRGEHACSYKRVEVIQKSEAVN